MLSVAAIAALFLAACGGGSKSAGGAAAGPTSAPAGQGASPTRAATSAATTAPAGGGRTASIQLSGGVTGALSLQGMTCGPGAIVSISGTIGTAQYTVEAQAPAAGSAQLSATGTAGVQLIETAPGFRRWAAGSGQSAGSGTLTIDARGGQVNAEVAGVQGNTGTVRVQGSWTCP
jgi:hypothetical protein